MTSAAESTAAIPLETAMNFLDGHLFPKHQQA
jgi:hypothetical protein